MQGHTATQKQSAEETQTPSISLWICFSPYGNVTAAAKRAVVVKEDDLLTKKEIAYHTKEVTQATIRELKIWIENKCFEIALLKGAHNIMTSRYVVKWKFVKNKLTGKMERIIRMRLVLRGFMDSEAFSLDTFSGTAKRSSQRMLASEAACHDDYILASMDVDKAFLKGFTYKELAEATGEKERQVYFTKRRTATIHPGLREGRRDDSLPTLHETRHWYEGCAAGI